MKKDIRDTLELIYYSFFGLFLIIASIYGTIHWVNTKPPPKYVNTLQRDINP